ncbi:MAG: VanZ family protein [Polaromonas sp.]
MNPSNPVALQPRRQPIPLLAWRLAFGACVLAVLVLALVPTDVPIPSTGWDKSNHLLAFSVMALLGMRAFPGRTMAVLAGLLAYGILIEVLQSFTPSRSADWRDVVADAVGLALGWAVVQLARLVIRLRAGPPA